MTATGCVLRSFRIMQTAGMSWHGKRLSWTLPRPPLAEAIPERAARPNADLTQLWRRIAFNIAVHNTDDHLRNHGFLRSPAGWLLAPAFDVNPNPEIAERRVTSIGGAGEPAEELEALSEGGRCLRPLCRASSRNIA